MTKKPDARTFGQDLMRGEHVVGEGKGGKANAIPGGSKPSFGGLDWRKNPAVVEDTGDRSGGLTWSGPATEFDHYRVKEGTRESTDASGTSIFDPVLCELAYRWFCPPGGTVLDPFAGGSVRGIVAAKLGRPYVGHELRPEQVEANRDQALRICGQRDGPAAPGADGARMRDDPIPQWIIGDSRTIDQTCAAIDADMIFSCPPYADLERYSDDPLDLSTMDYPAFRAAYFEIIRKTCDRLRADSFAVFVVGEVRDRKGAYIDFVGDTVQAFRDAGLSYYNEAILVTAAGSLPIRAGKQFVSSRKLGKTHQNVLTFVKGDGAKAARRCGPVELDPELFNEPAADGQASETPYGTEL